MTKSLSVVVIACCVAGASASADEKNTKSPEQIVLGTRSFWRVFVALRPPLLGTAEDARPDNEFSSRYKTKGGGVEARWPVIVMPPGQPHSPFPPAGWEKPGFDDSRWWRDPGPFYGMAKRGWKGHPRYGYGFPQGLALICLRGKFEVTDPTAVKDLELSAEFRGGAVVYLNGEEIHQAHIRDGDITLDTPAEDYPLDVFVSSKKRVMAVRDYEVDRCEKRIRSLEVSLPADKLRRGVNVLALELHRTALPAELPKMRGSTSPQARWATVGLCAANLTAQSADGLVPNTRRPKGIQVWNRNVMQVVTQLDYGDPSERLKPVRILGARNGVFSGQVLVGSDKPIKGLTAEISDLKGESASIERDRIAIRYPLVCARRWARLRASDYGKEGQFDTLASTAPAELKGIEDWRAQKNGYTGVTQPVWMTARVPADAAPGTYKGTLSIRVEGAGVPPVPVHLTVGSWTLPEPKDFHTVMDFIQSPESVALYYGVPFWSDRHFELMGKTFRLLAELGNKTIYIPVICRTNHGNEQAMVRWVRQSDGSYAPDTSLVGKYLDCALAAGLKPAVTCFQVWDYHVGYDKTARWGRGGYPGGPAPTKTSEVPVSVLDPSTGKVEKMSVAKYGTPESEKFWTPLVEPLRACLGKRGLEKTLMVGLCADFGPQKDAVDFWKKLLPEATWVTQGHWLPGPKKVHGVPIGYATMVTFADFGVDPGIKRMRGWNRPEMWAYFTRLRMGPLPPARLWAEWCIQGNLRGLGRQAADFWLIPVKGNPKKKYYVSARYVNSSWRNLNLRPSYLAPGPDGAVETVRFELLREGLQEAEARVAIGRALVDDAKRAKLGEEFAKEYQGLLDERTRYLNWCNEYTFCIKTFLPGGPLGFDWYAGGSDWQSRSERLFAVAGKVEEVLK